MELSTFIADTLTAIQEGVQTAIIQTESMKGVINPFWGSTENIGEKNIQKVHFDVAITTTTVKQGTTSGGIRILDLLDAGGDVSVSAQRDLANRIQFDIPIIPAGQVVKDTRTPDS